MAKKFKLISKGMKELLNSDSVRDDLTRRMDRVASTARATAPVDEGEYRDGIEVFQSTTDRVSVRVGSTAPHGLIVDLNTGNLVRALDSAGGT